MTDPTTYTAWITTEPSALQGPMCDVVILANDEDGGSTGDPLWTALTTVPCAAAMRDDTELIRQAKDLLLAAGWHQDGEVEDSGSGYIVNVWPVPPAYVVEVYVTEAPGSVGTLLDAWDGQLDADTIAWLDGLGYSPANPHIWVNIVPADEWAPNNHPKHQRIITAQSGTATEG